MMLSFGQFVFSLNTLAYQQLQRATAWRHAQNARVGARAASQFVGPDDETISLDGMLLPELAGTRVSLDTLRDMGGQGAAWPLVDGNGVVYGAFVLLSVHETDTLFFADGTPRRIEFALELRRVDDGRVAQNPRVGTLDDGSNVAGFA